MTTANKFQSQLPVIIEQIDDRLWTQIQLLVLTENHQKTFGFFVDSYLAQKHTLSSLKMVLLGSVKTWPLSSRNRTQLGSVFRAKLSTFSQLPSPVAVGFCWLNLKTKGLTLTGELKFRLTCWDLGGKRINNISCPSITEFVQTYLRILLEW